MPETAENPKARVTVALRPDHHEKLGRRAAGEGKTRQGLLDQLLTFGFRYMGLDGKPKQTEAKL